MTEVVARRAVRTGICCALLLAVVYLTAVWTRPGQRFEDAVLRGAAGALVADKGRTAFAVLDTISEPMLAAVVLLVFLAGLARGRLPLALGGAGLISAAVLTTEALHYVILSRPLLLGSGDRREDQTFPSGHTTIALSVLCALILVVPYRWRGVAAFAASVWATAVGLSTVTTSWHRPSDTIGGALVALVWTCAAIALLARHGRVREEEPPGPVARAVLGAAGGLQAAAALTALAVALCAMAFILVRAAGPGGSGAPAALLAGRAIAVAACAAVAPVVLALMHGVDLGRVDLGRPPHGRPRGQRAGGLPTRR